jgi:hypothetical protein
MNDVKVFNKKREELHMKNSHDVKGQNMKLSLSRIDEDDDGTRRSLSLESHQSCLLFPALSLLNNEDNDNSKTDCRRLSLMSSTSITWYKRNHGHEVQDS